MNDPANSSDEELADSLSDSDDQAIAVLAGRHTPPLYDFALRLTLDPESAAEITRAAFAYLRESGVRRPDGLSVRALLFNIVLERGLEVVNERDRPVTAVSSGDRRFTQVGAAIEREVALWAWQAARSLRPRDYAVLDLNLRRGLQAGELLGTAAQGRGGAQVVLDRASSAFAEAYVATALYFRGRDRCRELSELVGGSGAAMRVGIRRQIVSHVEDCSTCQATLDSLPSAPDVFQALHNVEPPAELLEQIVSSAGMAGAAAAAAGQLSLDDAPMDAGEEHDPAAAEEFGAGTEEWGGEEVTAEPASEEQLWARPEGAAYAGLAGDLPQALAGMEQRMGVEPSYSDHEQTEVYEQYGSEYAQDDGYGGYAPPPLTLGERFSMWFAPAYGRSFLWSYALLGVATAVAVYLGIAVADSVSGGGGGSLPAVGEDEVREIACETGPLTLESGSSAMFQFDPSALDGFQLDSVVVAERPAALSTGSLGVQVDGPTTMTAEAAPIFSPTAREDAYRLQILWQRNGEDAVTDCPLVVNVPAATGPAPTSGAGSTPEAAETPEGEETPQPTP